MRQAERGLLMLTCTLGEPGARPLSPQQYIAVGKLLLRSPSPRPAGAKVCREDLTCAGISEEYAEQILRLLDREEVLDRYLESGRFVHALWYLTPLMLSPFRFWEGLNIYLEEHDTRPLQRISQPDAFRYLLAYAEEAISDLDVAKLKEMLSADFSQHENKNPPAFLR